MMREKNELSAKMMALYVNDTGEGAMCLYNGEEHGPTIGYVEWLEKRASKSLEGVQNQTNNSQGDIICPSCKSTDIAVSEYLCLTCDGLFIKEAAGKRTPV